MSGQSLSALIEFVTVDTTGVDEKLMAVLVSLGDEVTLPCSGTVLDIDVEVIGFDLESDERRGLVARCRRAGRRPGAVALADVRFESWAVAAWLHAAFRAWLGLETFPARCPVRWSLPAR